MRSNTWMFLAGAALTIAACAGCRSAVRTPKPAAPPPAAVAPAPMPPPAVLGVTPTNSGTNLERVEILDAAKVCYGNPDEFTKAAEIDVLASFNEVREWKQILQRRLTGTDPEYWLLLEKANVRFRRALKLAAADAGVDLVADLGALRRWHDDVPQPLPNLTPSVLEAIRASEQIDDLHLSVASLR